MAEAYKKPTRALFCLSLLFFSLSLLSFAGTLVQRNRVESCAESGASASSCACLVGPPPPSSHTELLVGYKILHHTLSKESQLKYLHWLRGATLRGPEGSLKAIMSVIYETSGDRLSELEDLFRDEHPAISIGEAPVSAIGDSIQNEVEASSTAELVPLPFLSPTASREEWGVRFLLVQAQATRMVVALATSLRKLEKSEARKQWLAGLAAEYEAIREDLVECVGSRRAGGRGSGGGTGMKESRVGPEGTLRANPT